jgi:hypothetical protein
MSVTSPFGRKRASIARRVGGLDYLLKRGDIDMPPRGKTRVKRACPGRDPASDRVSDRVLRENPQGKCGNFATIFSNAFLYAILTFRSTIS